MSAFNTEDLKSEINTIINKSGESMDNQSTPLKINISNNAVRSSSKKKIKEEFFSSSSLIPRPHTIQDFVEKEKLIENANTESTLTFDDLNEDEEFWIIDIPRTVDPQDLKGLTLPLDDEKSSFKIGDVKYCASDRDSKSSLTCVFKADETNKCQAVNVKPVRILSIRKKLTKVSKKKIEYQKPNTVPFPKNIKIRHPLFGVEINQSAIKSER